MSERGDLEEQFGMFANESEEVARAYISQLWLDDWGGADDAIYDREAP